ncbi:ABC transporter substrate-binding protein [Streptomyces johnsoniae]|uniref:ABC transporter substrate-binding protein n=1 Tax=Streptomyces johnsoniae TaxID=3075532 RepID=A0ABU2S735_9ACTN|nr:ABC transporter substrate-binding protein [Streptomyces sp. DSM 41886]MDT0444727.1 ABC transporter substrate-binding protein [Streptomyces sp. DSM 41886]
MSEGSKADRQARRLSRRKFVGAGALAGAAGVGAPLLAPGTAGATAAPHAAPSRYATRSGAVCTPVPNQYDEPFEVCDDELFVFVANYKPFELAGFFDTVIGNGLAAAFPDIPLKVAVWDQPIRYEDLEAAGVVPDIIIDDPRRRIDRELEPRGWVSDLTGDLANAGIDLGTLNPAAVEMIRARSDGGVYGVPLLIDDFVLLHNKKIFDRFRVPYPTNGMTYDRAFRLAERLTREVDLVAYKGYLQHPDNYLDYNQLGRYPFLATGSENPAPEDIRVDITSEGWQRLGANMERFLFIPRNIFTTVDDFFQTGHVAMAVDTLWKFNSYALNEMYIDPADLEQWRGLAENVDLAVTSVPVLGGGDNATYQPNSLAAYVPPQSNKRRQALDVVKWLVSEEAQVTLSSYGIKPALRSDAVVDAFGSASPALAGIDTSGVFWGDNAVVTGYEQTEYWDIPMYMVFRQHVLKDGLSVSSALTITETVDIPNYIRAQAEAGFDW